MAKWITIIVLVAAGAGAYYYFFGPDSPAFAHYKTFAQLMYDKKFDEARQMTVGTAIAGVDKVHKMDIAMQQMGFETMVRPLSVSWDPISETATDDGKYIDLVVKQCTSVSRQGQGMPGYNYDTHKVRLQHDADKWIIVDFTTEQSKE